MLFCVNAEGQKSPPMLIFQFKRIPSDLAQSIPGTWGVGISENGWSTQGNFFYYITYVFHPWAVNNNIPFPIFFFMDGHTSHITYHLSKFCREKQIILVCLYPNATQVLQPLDVSVFRTLKGGWREGVSKWRLEQQEPALKRLQFASLLKEIVDERLTPLVDINGFRACGLYQRDPSRVQYMMKKKKNPPLTSTFKVIRIPTAHIALKTVL